jgi:hypothetical protein
MIPYQRYSFVHGRHSDVISIDKPPTCLLHGTDSYRNPVVVRVRQEPVSSMQVWYDHEYGIAFN